MNFDELDFILNQTPIDMEFDFNGETWKRFPLNNNYIVSKSGNIVRIKVKEININSIERILPAKKIKGSIFDTGYLNTSIKIGNIKRNLTYHQIIAITYLGHIPNKFKIVVDHIDNNKLNNKLSNLQLISNRENSSKDRINNTSNYTGVTMVCNKNIKKWTSRIKNGTKKQIYLGTFIDEKEAGLAYKKALKYIQEGKVEDIVANPYVVSSTYKGVHKRKNGKFQAQIVKNKKYMFLGTFENEIDAHYAYQSKYNELKGILNH
jgi:hypothetical protein